MKQVVDKHFLFYKLTNPEKYDLANVMQNYQTGVGEYIFKQGSAASMFFIINAGRVQI